MQPGTQPPARPLYGISRNKLEVLKKYLEADLSKKYIRTSTSSAVALVLFVKKPGGGLQFCVDYCGLNVLTIKNKYPLPLIQETMDHLCKVTYFIKLNIIKAFNRIYMAADGEWKMAFRTNLDLYKCLVLLPGLSNVTGTFKNYINIVLENDILNLFVTAYIDNILVFSKTLQGHRKQVKIVLAHPQVTGLQLDIEKC